MTKEEIFEALAAEIKLRGMSPRTYKTYQCGMTLFLDWAGKPYEELDEKDFRKYLLYLHYETNIKPATINSYNAAVRFLLVNILGKDINYRRTARIRHVYSYPDIWSREEIERFFSVIDSPRDLAIFINIYGSGLRVSEICNLKIQDVDSKGMRLFLRQAKGKKIVILFCQSVAWKLYGDTGKSINLQILKTGFSLEQQNMETWGLAALNLHSESTRRKPVLQRLELYTLYAIALLPMHWKTVLNPCT
jgi:integrase